MLSILSRVTHNGRQYEVLIHPENKSRAMYLYCHIYPIRKDGRRGCELVCHGNVYMEVYLACKETADA